MCSVRRVSSAPGRRSRASNLLLPSKRPPLRFCRPFKDGLLHWRVNRLSIGPITLFAISMRELLQSLRSVCQKLELQRPRSTPSCLLPDQPSVSPGSLSLLDDRGPLAGCSARARPRVPRPSTDPPSICCDGGVPARSPTGRGFGHHGAPFSFWFWWPTHSFTSSLGGPNTVFRSTEKYIFFS